MLFVALGPPYSAWLKSLLLVLQCWLLSLEWLWIEKKKLPLSMVYWHLSGPPGKTTTINWWFNWFNTNSIGNFVDGLLQIEPSPNHPQNRLYRDKPRYFRPASRVTRACNSSGLRYLPSCKWTSCKWTSCLDQTWQFEITYEWRVFMGKSPINGKIIPSYTWFKYVPCLWMSFHGKIMAFIEDCNYCPLPSLYNCHYYYHYI